MAGGVDQTKVSVAMCTYNGAMYVQEQLDSFLRQSRVPDEVVICDDGSVDDTVEILEEFRGRAPFDVRIYCNPTRLGVTRNFECAIEHCNGDIIFLSDQDDIWIERKVERVLEEFAANPRCLVVINDAEIVNGQLSPSGLTKVEQTLAAGATLGDFVTGCCTSFRARFRDLVLPISAEDYTHDSWVNRLGESLGVRVVVEEVLQSFRRHELNASQELSSSRSRLGVRNQVRFALQEDPLTYCRKQLRRNEAIAFRIEASRELVARVIDDPARIEAALYRLEKRGDAINDRITVLRRRWLGRITGAFWLYMRGGYREFAGWKSVLWDCRP